MIYSKRRAILIVAAAVFLSLLPAGAQTVLYREDFETYAVGAPPPDGWEGFSEGQFTFKVGDLSWPWVASPHTLVYATPSNDGAPYQHFCGFKNDSIIAAPIGYSAESIAFSFQFDSQGTAAFEPHTVSVYQSSGGVETWRAQFDLSSTPMGLFEGVVTGRPGQVPVVTGVYHPDRGLGMRFDFVSGEKALFIDDVVITAGPESGTAPIVMEEDYTFRTLTRGSVVVSGFGGGGIALDSMDNVYVADSYYGIVRKIDSEGNVSHVTNLGGAMRSERPWQTPLLSMVRAETLNNPRGIAVDGAGNLYVGDYDTGTAQSYFDHHTLYLMGGAIKKIGRDGTETILAGDTKVSGLVDGPGAAARFSVPKGLAVDKNGSIYVADTGAGFSLNSDGAAYQPDPAGGIRKIDPNGVVTTFAVGLKQPSGVAVDTAGTVFVADTGNHCIRKIMPAGWVTIGMPGVAGSLDGVGSAALFHSPKGVAVDSSGNLYVADTGNHTIRKITPEGAVTTLGGLAGGAGDAEGTGTNAHFSFPGALVVDNRGTLYVADYGNSTIHMGYKTLPDYPIVDLKVAPTGVARQLGTDPQTATDWEWRLTQHPVGSRAELPSTTIRDPTFTPDLPGDYAFVLNATNRLTGARASRTLELTALPTSSDNHPPVLTVPPMQTISALDTLRVTNLVSDPDQPPNMFTFALLCAPSGVSLNPTNGLLTWTPTLTQGPSTNCIRLKVTDDGRPPLSMTQTLWVNVRLPAPLPVQATALEEYTFRTLMRGPVVLDGNGGGGVAVNEAGSVYVADSGAGTGLDPFLGFVRKIDPGGTVSSLAILHGVYLSSWEGINNPRGIAVDWTGNVYFADYGLVDDQGFLDRFGGIIRKISPDGSLVDLAGSLSLDGLSNGTAEAVRFSRPMGLALDNDGNLYVADTGNSAIRKINPLGVVTTVATGFNGPTGIAVDAAGRLFVADTDNHTIQSVGPRGSIAILAGRPGLAGSADGISTSARFYRPKGVAVDCAGNVYVTDTGNHTIRKIGPGGVVTTVGGTAGVAGKADGTGGASRFSSPGGVAVDCAGVLYVADYGNASIREGIKNLLDSPIVNLRVAPAGLTRQLDVDPQTGTGWTWSLTRRPSGSKAELSSTTITDPTFTPDVSGEYELVLRATNRFTRAISSGVLELTALPALPDGSSWLTWSGLLVDGSFELTLVGQAGLSYELETSSDLRAWVLWTNISQTVFKTTVNVPILQAQRFYRARTR